MNIIVAYDLNRGIGLDNTIPWHLPSDLKQFNRLTTGCCIVMGRKTWDSLPHKPLPNRVNIVMSKTLIGGCASFDALDELLKTITTPIFFIGGYDIYKEASQRYPINEYHITEVLQSFPCDTYCPQFDLSNYTLKSSILSTTDPIYRYQVYQRQK